MEIKKIYIKKLIRKALLLSIISLFSISIIAQNDKIVIGVIKDMQGVTMPGVTVRVKGYTIGTSSDADGNYSIKVPADANTLIVSFIGMKPQEVTIDGRSVINLELEEDAVLLNEIVTIGYGVKTRATTTGAVDLIDKKQFEDRPMTNTTAFLQGIAPGVEIRRHNAGNVGEEGFDIQIRGVTSRADPGVLIVVDGIPYKDNNASALNKLNPADIENITILKDAQAAIYGARAAGGVLLVTTKKGSTGKPTISYSGDFSFNKPSRFPQKVNILQHIDMMNQAYLNDGIATHQYSHLVQYINTADIHSKNPLVVKGVFGDTPDLVLGYHDWWKEMYGTAFDHSHNMTISGKSDKTNYYTSIGYLDQNSMFRYGDHSNRKFFGRFKLDYDINKYLKLRTNVYVGQKRVKEPYNIGHLAWLTYWTWNCQPTYNEQGQYYGAGGFGNPVAYAKHIGKMQRDYYSYYTQLGFDLKPIDNLMITGDFSWNIDMVDERYSRKRHQTYHWDGTLNYDVIDYWFSGKTKAESIHHRNDHKVASIYANYDFKLDKNMFNIMVGGSHEELENRGFNAYRYDLITDELDVMSIGDPNQQFNGEYVNDWAISSYFGRLSYNYDSRYFLEATYRNDGSSRFAAGKKWEDFWGVSGSWIISNENFFAPVKNIVDYAKIRLSYGQLGNQAGIGFYDHYQYINVGGQHPFGNPDSPSKSMVATLGGMPSVDRTWETIEAYNAGFDFFTLKSRLGGTFDYYVKENKNMFYAEEFPSVLGTAAPQINGAHLRTNGWEISLNWKDHIGKVNYRIGATLSNNTSKVIKLKDARSPGYGHNSFIEGYAANSYFLYTFDGFINSEEDLQKYQSTVKGPPTNLKIGDAKYRDLDGDGTLEPHLYKAGDPNSGDIEYKGDGNQHYLYGINLEFDWNGIDFRAFLQGVGKWMVMNNTYAAGPEVWKQSSEYFYKNTWSPERPNAEYPRLTQDGGAHWYNYQHSDAPYKFVNNRYLRLKDIQLGYSFNKNVTKKLSLDKLRVYVSGTNLFEFDNLPDGFDPETPFYENLIPFTRTFSFGLNVTF